MRTAGLLVLLALAASTAFANDFGAYFDEIINDRDFQALTYADDFGIEEIALRVPAQKEKCIKGLPAYYDDATKECVFLNIERGLHKREI